MGLPDEAFNIIQMIPSYMGTFNRYSLIVVMSLPHEASNIIQMIQSLLD